MQCLRMSAVSSSRFACTHFCGTRWLRSHHRSHASQAPPAWFMKLREEMLSRQLPQSIESIGKQENQMLEDTLSAHVPGSWFKDDRQYQGQHLRSFLPLGFHQIHFFNVPGPHETLPDGSDTIHYPGLPFMRRMWAGGSLRIDAEKYYSMDKGWRTGELFVCGERIDDVQLRGQEGAEKLFVTIERRFAHGSPSLLEDRNPARGLMRQARSGVKWGCASLVEERILVFMRERSDDEKRALCMSQRAPVKYLKPPGVAQFSHTLTPDPNLLFRFSALTFNAHAIHLNPQFAREVEGHHNLLVHGPLSLTLMLSFLNNHLHSVSGPPRVIHSIEYRNIAPLYSGEALRLCGRAKTRDTDDGSLVYDVWIEGPSGSMSVKGTARAAPIVGHLPTP